MKEPGKKLRSTVDCRGLEMVTEQTAASIPRYDKIFYRLGQDYYFSKLHLESGSRYISLCPSVIEKEIFNQK